MIVIRQIHEHCLKAIAAIAIALTVATPEELQIARAQKPNDKSATVHGEMILWRASHDWIRSRSRSRTSCRIPRSRSG